MNVWVILSWSISYIIYYSYYVPTFLKLGCSMLCFLPSVVLIDRCLNESIGLLLWLIRLRSSIIDHLLLLRLMIGILPPLLPLHHSFFPPPSFWWMILVIVFLFISIQDVTDFLSLSSSSSSYSYSYSYSSSLYHQQQQQYQMVNQSFITIFLIIIIIIQYCIDNVLVFVLFNLNLCDRNGWGSKSKIRFTLNPRFQIISISHQNKYYLHFPSGFAHIFSGVRI